MHIYAIGDLHLSGEPPAKPMEIFGSHWADHKNKIKANWLASVTPQDTVIICGDISWALQLEEARPDLDWLAALPGRKILLRGNHDYWWTSLKKMQQFTQEQFLFLQNNCIMSENIAICGTRGWILPSSENFTEADQKIYQRESIRLELSLQAAVIQKPEKIICVFHYPPLFAADEHNLFTDLLTKYHVSHCVYGHIHGENHILTYEGCRDEVNYKLVSCDTQQFQLYRII